MSLHATWAELSSGLADLGRQWHDTRATWRDTVAQEYEVNYHDALERHVRSALNAMSQLAPVLEQMRRECE